MKDLSEAQRTTITRLIDRAWPCYVHYANAADLAGDPAEIHTVLTQLDAVLTNSQSEGVPIKVPSPLNVTEIMVLGHEHHAGCIALAHAITRCIPALTHLVGDLAADGGLACVGDTDPYTVRSSLADVHRLYHRLDPTGQDDTALIEALCITQTPPDPIELGSDWQYMVRLTHDHAMGGPLGAFHYMPMRCFVSLDDARNWSLLQAIWDCHILGEDPAPNLADPNYKTIVRELTHHDGSDRTWQLPFSNATLRFTRHNDGR